MGARTTVGKAAAAVMVALIGFSSRTGAARGAVADGQGHGPERCRIEGRVTSGGVPLPGVSIGVRSGDGIKPATSTDVQGHFSIIVTPQATYHLSVEFTGFASEQRDVAVGAVGAVGASPCDRTADFQLGLESRTPARPRPMEAERNAPAARPNAIADASTPAGRGGQRFQTLTVQADANAAGAPDEAPALDDREVAALLPPGFAIESAQADAIAFAGSSNATNLNRGFMNDRLQAIDAGQLDPATGQFAQGFGRADGFDGGPEAGAGPFGGRGGGRSGRGGGPGGFILGGRGARGQSPYQGSATYTFGGSALNSPPYQLRPDVAATQPEFAQNNFGGTFGGPLKIPGIYADANRRTNFQINYSGSEANNVFDQYATVPTDAMRAGDFSGSPIALIDPSTGQSFAGNQIPSARVDPSALSLLRFIPSPNLPGSARNYHISTPAHSSSEAISLRLTQNLSPTVPQGGRGGAGGRGGQAGRGFGGGFGGRRGGPPNGRTNIVLNAQLQYRQNTTETLNVFPDLGGTTTNRSVAVPLSLNIVHGRSIQNVSVNLTHATSQTTNGFSGSENVAGLAGIQYPGAAPVDPVNWGVPNLTFTSFTGVRGTSANQRADDRLTTGYMWLRPFGEHRTRVGGDFRLDRSDYAINDNARGSFTFTGQYAMGQRPSAASSGADFADFLLGLPAQASLQAGGTSRLRQRSFDAYVEDNWQKSAKLTFNLGLRYELAKPYVEVNGRMANLDATADLASVTPVLPGGVGPYTGAFPASLLNTDANNLGPRLGVAYRLTPKTIVRGGYGITYNSGSYASIARQLSGQPPFAETETISGTEAAPLTLAEALLASPQSTTTNNWAVDRDYALGMIQTWNATLTSNLTQDWMLQAGYTGIKGTDLDILRAPSLGAGGVPIPGVQAFIWESSGGRSIMNAGNLQVRRRLAKGYSGAVSYTFAHAMDNASSLGAGAPIVAQNDKDLEAEWARSSFERRHQLSGTLYVELPWGPNRRWLKDGGALAALFGEWSAQLTLTLQSGPPLTVRVLGAASDLLRGVNGSLRADYNGGPIQLSNPTVDAFFDTTAFSTPGPGAFGDSARNLLTGPGTRQLNALFQRDVRAGARRSVTIQVNALNLFNTVQWAAVDTNINSQTFGEVLSARPMRTITITARLRF